MDRTATYFGRAAGAPLRCGTGGRVEPAAGPRSDRLGELGERCGDPLGGWGVDGEFVVAAAQVLHEGVSGDDYLMRANESYRVVLGADSDPVAAGG
jgi:hypothetical protein